LSEAEPLYQRALAMYEELVGSEHPDVAVVLHDLAHLSVSQGKSSEAEPLYQRALAIRVQWLGPEHPDTQATLQAYGSLSLQKENEK
jgi:hypothetical protein